MGIPIHHEPLTESRMQERLTHIEDKIDRVLLHIEGEPGETSKGLLTRVDRLEQSEVRRNVWVGAAITAGVGAIVMGLWGKLTGKA